MSKLKYIPPKESSIISYITWKDYWVALNTADDYKPFCSCGCVGLKDSLSGICSLFKQEHIGDNLCPKCLELITPMLTILRL